MKLIIELTDLLGVTTVATLNEPFSKDPSVVDALLGAFENNRVFDARQVSFRFTKNISDEDFTRIVNHEKHPHIERLDERHFKLL